MKLLSLEPESSASANSAIPAGTWHIIDLTDGFVKRFCMETAFLRQYPVITLKQPVEFDRIYQIPAATVCRADRDRRAICR